jgi:enamine deaminase RidA (YjgF/YER057c/UK114 family)
MHRATPEHTAFGSHGSRTANAVTPDERIRELGLVLPEPPPPVGRFVLAVEVDKLLFVSGHGPFRAGEYHYIGKVDSVVSVDDAREAARLTMVNALGSVHSVLGTLDRVDRVVKLLGMVNSDPDFQMQPRVIDAASELLGEVFGDAGMHARSAVGVGALPMGISVEIEMILALK